MEELEIFWEILKINPFPLSEWSDYSFCKLGKKDGKIMENPRNGCLLSVSFT